MALDINEILANTALTPDQKAFLQTQLAAAETEKASVLAYRQQLVDWQAGEKARLAATQPKADPVTPSYLTQANLDQALGSMQGEAIGLMSMMTKRGLEYYQEFGKPLDVDAVLKKAQEDRSDFQVAYERFVAPAKAEKAAVELEARIKRERTEAAQEALANASLPTIAGQNGFGVPQGGNSHILDMVANKGDKQFGWKAAADAHSRDIATGTVKTLS